ncbi:MAG: hypothetical protein E7181_05295 [Erysipelotrichaceae bacterium]|nr:hypothetical protein [Erysipelotrichaceae bacterium]
MRKASDILLLIGSILGVIGAIFGLIAVISLFVAAGNRDAIIEGLKNGTIHTSFVGNVEQQADAIIRMLNGAAIALLVAEILDVIGLVIIMIARKKGTTMWYIVTLVLSVLVFSILPLIGSILGLVANSESNGGNEEALE